MTEQIPTERKQLKNQTGVYGIEMIKLRLKRYGKKREASYRIVAAKSTSRRDGRPLEELGFYNPRTDETRLNVPAIVKRLKEGAQPTDTVRDILRKANVLEQARTGVQFQPAAVSNVESREANADIEPQAPADNGSSEAAANTETSEITGDTDGEQSTSSESSDESTSVS